MCNFTRKQELGSDILWVIVSAPFKLNFFDIFGNSKNFHTVLT